MTKDEAYIEGYEKAREEFRAILNSWQEHATRGMRKGSVAYHQGKIALIIDLLEWLKNPNNLNYEIQNDQQVPRDEGGIRRNHIRL